MDLTIATHRVDASTAVIELHGELDLATAPQLHDAIVDAVANQARLLVVDLRGVGFVDSSGLGVLVGGMRRARTAGGELRLVVTNPTTRKLLRITGLDEIFTAHESPEAACAALPEPTA